jgi:hypothetical protein
LTGERLAFNLVSGVTIPAVQYDPATDAVTWISRGFASVHSTASAYAEPDHQAVQLVQAMAAYAPEPSASIRLAAVSPENSQLLLAASTY